MPAVERIVNENLDAIPYRRQVVQASLEEDCARNTDMLIVGSNESISCHIRKYGDLKFSDEFTIRDQTNNGAKAEIIKVAEGHGDYLFYGFAQPEGPELAAWFIGDLSVFRHWYMWAMYHSKPKTVPGGNAISNDDGTSFRPYKIAHIGDAFVVASHRIPWDGDLRA